MVVSFDAAVHIFIIIVLYIWIKQSWWFPVVLLAIMFVVMFKRLLVKGFLTMSSKISAMSDRDIDKLVSAVNASIMHSSSDIHEVDEATGAAVRYIAITRLFDRACPAINFVFMFVMGAMSCVLFSSTVPAPLAIAAAVIAVVAGDGIPMLLYGSLVSKHSAIFNRITGENLGSLIDDFIG